MKEIFFPYPFINSIQCQLKIQRYQINIKQYLEMQEGQAKIKMVNSLAYKLDQIDHEQERTYHLTIFSPRTETSYIIDVSHEKKTKLPKSIEADFFVQKELRINIANKKQIVNKFAFCSCDELNLAIRNYFVFNFCIEGFFGIPTQIRAFNYNYRQNGKQHSKIFDAQQLSQLIQLVEGQANQLWTNYQSTYCKGFDKKNKQRVQIAFHILPFLQYEVQCFSTPKFDDNIEKRIEKSQGYNHQISVIIEVKKNQANKERSEKFLQIIKENIKQYKAIKSTTKQHRIDLLNSPNAHPSKIFNPHIYSKFLKKDKYELIMVKGIYQYYHYGDQNFTDNGWGCAYRALQTLISWLRIQGHLKSSNQMLSIVEIQEKLDSMDRSRKLKGSNAWIGATQISWIVPTITTNQINCKILHVANGKNILEKCEQFKNHFLTSGCPIMYGGGQYAYSIVGMHYNWKLGQCQFLILDPHYTGEDDFAKILQKKGLAWRKPQEMFKAGIFYNFCLPIIK